LELIAEQPRHGYELIKALEERYGGFYRPSPGSVYPTLQLLEDEGHLTSETVDGKRVYTITESGSRLLAERDEERRGERGRHGPSPELHELRRNTMALADGVMQVARHGTPEQARAAAQLLERTRRELYGLLAQDAPEQQ
jgi:DNA-binding PadR family transcriptional regulator